MSPTNRIVTYSRQPDLYPYGPNLIGEVSVEKNGTAAMSAQLNLATFLVGALSPLT